MQINREATFIATRDKLIETGLFEYRKGKKGSPNQYKINTTILKVQMEVKRVVQTEVKSEVKRVVQTADINRLDKDLFIILFNKYKSEVEGKSFGDKIQKINECKESEEFKQLSEQNQKELFNALISL